MIIDIRSNYKYMIGHIDNALNIEYHDLLLNYKKYLNKNEIYYIYCDSVVRSKIVVSKLNNLGYNCVNIDGGYSNYLLNR